MPSIADIFGDLRGQLAVVMADAPNFPYREYLPPDGQNTLDSMFAELRDLFEQFASKIGECEPISNCRQWIEEAYQMYKQTGETDPGGRKINDVYNEVIEIMQKRRRKEL